MQDTLVLMSHHLCPYVQRAIISLEEKGVPYQRKYIDLADKPDWFTDISPLGKTPVLTVNNTAIFESSVILEYLEDTQIHPLHPNEPLGRAQHRAWIEFGTATLNDISGFYNAKDADAFSKKAADLSKKFKRIEQELGDTPYFNGAEFSLVDVAFGPVFRYFDVFDQIGDFGVFKGKPKVTAWRKALALRPTVSKAVTPDYNKRLLKFLKMRKTHISRLMS